LALYRALWGLVFSGGGKWELQVSKQQASTNNNNNNNVVVVQRNNNVVAKNNDANGRRLSNSARIATNNFNKSVVSVWRLHTRSSNNQSPLLVGTTTTPTTKAFLPPAPLSSPVAQNP
jgi:hypothetical protein